MTRLIGSTLSWTLRQYFPLSARSQAIAFAMVCAMSSASVIPAAPRPATEPAGDEPSLETEGTPPSATILATLSPTSLRDLAGEVLVRNPQLARAHHRASSLAARAPQQRSKQDPVAAVTWFVMPPQTRVGPQRLSFTLSQRFPWFGKLELRERAALWQAVASLADVEKVRLELLTETRRLFYELSFLEEQEKILRNERDTLARFEEAARARYSAGAGLQQEILRIQAQITRTDERVLMLRERRSELSARLNRLRDRPASSPVSGLELPSPQEVELDSEALRDRAWQSRPDMGRAEADVERQRVLVELARKRYKPDFSLSLGYSLVDRRDDLAGEINPPEGDGDDIVSLGGAIDLPVRRAKREAGLQEALFAQLAAEEARRHHRSEIESELGDLSTRLPLLLEHWQLLATVLSVQAREALSSAEAAYTTGSINAVDLLDSEVVMLEVRTGAARMAADWAIAIARLEAAAAAPLAGLSKEGGFGS